MEHVRLHEWSHRQQKEKKAVGFYAERLVSKDGKTICDYKGYGLRNNLLPKLSTSDIRLLGFICGHTE